MEKAISEILEVAKSEDFIIVLASFFSFFLTGYYLLFIFFKESFLNLDILTRIILSVCVSVPISLYSIIVFPTPKKSTYKDDLISSFLNSIFIIAILSLIELLKFSNIILLNNQDFMKFGIFLIVSSPFLIPRFNKILSVIIKIIKILLVFIALGLIIYYIKITFF